MYKQNLDNTTITAYRVFETLKFLIKQPASVTDIIKHLESLNLNNSKPYSKGVIYKYITTLKFAGIQIKRNKCKYEVVSIPFKIPFDNDDLKTILTLKNIIEQIPETNITRDIRELLYILNLRVSTDLDNLSEIENSIEPINLDIPNTNQDKMLKQYEKYCKDNQKLNIEYYNIYGEKLKIKCKPIEAKFENNNVLLYCYIDLSNEFIELNSNQIVRISQLPTVCTSSTPDNLASATIYELKDKLVKRYQPRKNETLQNNEDKAIVINKTEAKNILHLRLMRYGTCCEIKSPKTERKLMQEMIAKTLSNYNISYIS